MVIHPGRQAELQVGNQRGRHHSQNPVGGQAGTKEQTGMCMVGPVGTVCICKGMVANAGRRQKQEEEWGNAAGRNRHLHLAGSNAYKEGHPTCMYLKNDEDREGIVVVGSRW